MSSELKSNVSAVSLTIIGIAGACFVAFVLYCDAQNRMTVKATKSAARMCLAQQRDMTVEVRGHRTECVFLRGTTQNIAIASNEITKQRVVDYNVSRIAGAAAGRSLKEAAKGMWSGLHEKSKHEPE